MHREFLRGIVRPPRPRAGRLPLVGLVFLGVGGCQTYERHLLDVPGYRAAFLARTPESAEVRAFADALAAQDPGPGTRGFDPFDGVSCAEAEVIALVFNAELRVARLRAGVTRALAEHAGLWEDPMIGVDLTRIVEGTPEPWKVSASVGLTIPVTGRLAAETRRAGAEHDAELARIVQREWAVRMGVRRAWVERSALVAQVGATCDFVRRIEQILAVVDGMQRAGETARSEARLFRIERATKAAELASLESLEHQADLRLRHLMGMSPGASLEFDEGGVGPARGSAGRGVNNEELECRNPAMLAAEAEYEASENALELEIRKQYPDLHLGPGYGREDGRDQVLLGLSVPIPILNANRRGIATARARREVARAAIGAALEQTIADLRAAEVRLDAAARRRRMFESEIVPLVDAQYEDARRLAGLGEVNTFMLLESLTRQQEAKIALVRAARDEAFAGVDLDEAEGPPPEPSPGCAASTHDPSINPTTKSGSDQ
jgi:outer membrane protein, heavy metal efflux system